MFVSIRVYRTLSLLSVFIFLVMISSQIKKPSLVQAGTSQNWSPPLEIESIDQAVAVTRSIDQTVHVVGVQNGLSTTLVHVLLAPGASSWSTPEPIGTTNTGGGVRSIDVVTTPDGRVHVVWDVTELNQRRVQYAVRSTSGSWSTPQVLSTMSYDANQVSIIVGSQNKIYVNWWQSGSLPGLFTRYQDVNEMWRSAEQVDSGTGYPSQQETFVDADGNVHFFWNDLSGTPTVGGVYHRMLSDAGVWQSATKVSDDLFASSAWVSGFRAALLGDELYLIWRQYQAGGGDTDLYSANTDGGVWSSAQLVENTTNSTPGFLGIEGSEWFFIDRNSGSLRLLTRSSLGEWTIDSPAWASGNVFTAVSNPDKSLHLFLTTSNFTYRFRDPMGTWADEVVLDNSASSPILEETVPYQYDLVWTSANGTFYSHSSFVFPKQLFLPNIVKP